MSVSCECYVSGTGLCKGPIPRPEESFWLCVREFSVIGCSSNTTATVSRAREVRLRKKW